MGRRFERVEIGFYNVHHKWAVHITHKKADALKEIARLMDHCNTIEVRVIRD